MTEEALSRPIWEATMRHIADNETAPLSERQLAGFTWGLLQVARGPAVEQYLTEQAQKVQLRD
jgi:hypothetical protein